LATPTRHGLITSGAWILGIGVVVTLVTMMAATGGGSYVVAWGAIAVGIARIARGLSMRVERVDHDWRKPMSGQDEPEDPAPQIAGSKCVHCASKILFALEAKPCGTCGEPLHRDCRKDHRVAAHSRAAYR
jgi:hypothetical protein